MMTRLGSGHTWLKAFKQFSALRTALAAHQTKHATNSAVEPLV